MTIVFVDICCPSLGWPLPISAVRRFTVLKCIRYFAFSQCFWSPYSSRIEILCKPQRQGEFRFDRLSTKYLIHISTYVLRREHLTSER